MPVEQPCRIGLAQRAASIFSAPDAKRALGLHFSTISSENRLREKIPRSARPHCRQKCPPTEEILRLAICLVGPRQARKLRSIGLIRSLARYSQNDLIEQSHGERLHKSMTKPYPALVTPTTEIRTVARRSTPRRSTNAALPTRECLAQMSSKSSSSGQAQSPRPPQCVLIFLAYRHGLRAPDLVDLR